MTALLVYCNFYLLLNNIRILLKQYEMLNGNIIVTCRCQNLLVATVVEMVFGLRHVPALEVDFSAFIFVVIKVQTGLIRDYIL